MTELRIKSQEDYFTKFCNGFLLEDQKLVENHYSFETKHGKGTIEHIMMDDGLEVVLHDMLLDKELEYRYTLDYSNFEIIYCLDGCLQWGDATTETEIRAGDNQFLKNPPCTRWEKYGKGCWKSISICFNDVFLKKFPEYCIDTFDEKQFDELINGMMMDIMSPEIKVSFSQMDKCNCPLNSTYRLLYMKGKAIEIISLFLQNYFLQRNELKNTCLKREDLNKIKEAKEVLTDNYIHPLSIKELSKYIGLNTYKLKVGFKEIYNTTIYGYVRDIRMEKAREYLIEGDKNVIDIANLVGYSNPSHFSVAFKKKFGVNPSELKK